MQRPYLNKHRATSLVAAKDGRKLLSVAQGKHIICWKKSDDVADKHTQKWNK